MLYNAKHTNRAEVGNVQKLSIGRLVNIYCILFTMSLSMQYARS